MFTKIITASASFGCLTLLALPVAAAAQTIPASEVRQFQQTTTQGFMLVDSVEPGETYDVRMWTTTLPVTFSRLVKNDENEWRIGPDVSIGGSYVYLVGDGTGQSDKSVKVDPQFFVGPVLQAGIGEDPNDETVTAALMLGGVLGIKGVAAVVGYDMVQEEIVIGMGTKIGTFIAGNLTSLRSTP